MHELLNNALSPRQGCCIDMWLSNNPQTRWSERVCRRRELQTPRTHLALSVGRLMPNQSPLDATIMKPIKKEWRLGLQRVLFGRRVVNEGKHKLSREKAVGTVLSAVKNVSTKNLKSRHVKKSFDVCGLNPWYYDLVNFE